MTRRQALRYRAPPDAARRRGGASPSCQRARRPARASPPAPVGRSPVEPVTTSPDGRAGPDAGRRARTPITTGGRRGEPRRPTPAAPDRPRAPAPDAGGRAPGDDRRLGCAGRRVSQPANAHRLARDGSRPTGYRVHARPAATRRPAGRVRVEVAGRTSDQRRGQAGGRRASSATFGSQAASCGSRQGPVTAA
ncbi:MAG: hypothetical protein MZV65_34230 [Chromatiales bacterium]|nr:hypothetical protein [Chromatiales bacterium]